MFFTRSQGKHNYLTYLRLSSEYARASAGLLRRGSPLLPTNAPARYMFYQSAPTEMPAGRRPGGVLWRDLILGLAVLVRLLASRNTPAFPISLVKHYGLEIYFWRDLGLLFTIV